MFCISFQSYEARLKIVHLLHSAATVRMADELITLQGDLNANWFSILTVEGVAVQLHIANIKLGRSGW
jgi:putative effector of murein hydrolase